MAAPAAGGERGEGGPVPEYLAARLHQLDRLIPAVMADEGAWPAADAFAGQAPLGALADGFAAGVSLEDLRSERAALAAAATGNGLAFGADERQELPLGDDSRRELQGYIESQRWTAGYIERQRERRSEREMRPEKLAARLAVTAKRGEGFFYLSGQRLASETASVLVAELPKIAPKVQELYLGAALYDLGELGWGPVAALARVHPLSKLYLGSNDIGDAGVVGMHTSNPNHNWNPGVFVERPCVAALVAALAGSPTLQLLGAARAISTPHDLIARGCL